MKDLTIAVVGATGAVGTEFLRIIEERHPELHQIKLLASTRSAGRRISVNGRERVVEETNEDSFHGVDIAFISVSSEVSLRWAPLAQAAGAVVIDDSSAFRMRDDVPLVVPEVNAADLEWHQGIISIPNCATTPLVMVAHPLHRVNPIVRITAATYQSVSGAGGAAMAELRQQSRQLLEGGRAEPRALPHQIAFNLIPRIDRFLPNGYTVEEQKMVQETRKIMHAPAIALSATCVRVPVYVSHSAALHIELERPMSPQQAREILGRMPGVKVLDAPEEGLYPMPWDVSGTDDVFVGRIRQDISHPNGLALWVVADNLRKGAALNSIQIAEELVARGCVRPRLRGATSKSPGNPGDADEEGKERAAFEEDLAYYKSNLEAFLRDYQGRWIAIINKSVVDSGPEFSSLAKRVYAKYGYKAILMTHVEAESRVVRIPSPRLAKR